MEKLNMNRNDSVLIIIDEYASISSKQWDQISAVTSSKYEYKFNNHKESKNAKLG